MNAMRSPPGLNYPSSSSFLLVIAEENLDWQPGITADLEAVWQAAELLHLLVCERPAVKLEVSLDAGSSDRLGDDAGAALETPHKAITGN